MRSVAGRDGASRGPSGLTCHAVSADYSPSPLVMLPTMPSGDRLDAAAERDAPSQLRRNLGGRHLRLRQAGAGSSWRRASLIITFRRATFRVR